MSSYLPVDTVEHRDFCAAPAVTLMRYKSGSRAVCRDCGASRAHRDPRAGTCRDCDGPTTSSAFLRCRDCHADHQARVAAANAERIEREAQARADAHRARQRAQPWRCREHPDEPVRRTARGYAKGCRKCSPKPPTRRNEPHDHQPTHRIEG